MIPVTKIAYCPPVIILPSYSVIESLGHCCCYFGFFVLFCFLGQNHPFTVSLEARCGHEEKFWPIGCKQKLWVQLSRSVLNNKGHIVFNLIFLLDGKQVMTGASAAIFDYEATLKMETTPCNAVKWKVPDPRSSKQPLINYLLSSGKCSRDTILSC